MNWNKYGGKKEKAQCQGYSKNGPKHQTHTQKCSFNAGNHSPKSKIQKAISKKAVLQKRGNDPESHVEQIRNMGARRRMKAWLAVLAEQTNQKSLREQQAWIHRQWLTNETQVYRDKKRENRPRQEVQSTTFSVTQEFTKLKPKTMTLEL